MAIDNGKIVSPVKITDICSVLKCDVDLRSACFSEDINMFSRIKPMRLSSPVIFLSKTDPGTGVPNWLVDDDGYGCGIKLLDRFSKGTDVRSAWNNHNLSRWKYNRIQAGDWRRIRDFEGYNHNAIAPWGKSLYCTNKVLAGQNVSLYTTERVQDQDSVGFQHMSVQGTQLADMYFGCFFAGNPQCVITNTKKLITYENGQTMVNCTLEVGTTDKESLAGLLGGMSYTAYPLLSMDPLSNYRSESGSFYDIPLAPVDFSVVTRGYIADGISYGHINGTSLDIRIYAKAVANVTYRGTLYLVNPSGVITDTVNDVFFNVYGAGHDFNDPAVGYQQLTISRQVTDNWKIRYHITEDGEPGYYDGEIRIVNVIPT